MKLRYAKANIRRVFGLRTALEERDGIGWYREARRDLQAASDAAGVPLEVAAHITAALSPNIRWSTNLAATKKALEVVGQPNWRERLGSLTLAGFPKNSTKAKDILIAWVEGRDWAGILSGPKVRAFADSLIGRPDAEVVVDVHAYSVAANRRWTVKTIPDISNLRRRIVSDAYRAVAKEAGLSPAEVQAVTWVTWRRLHKV